MVDWFVRYDIPLQHDLQFEFMVQDKVVEDKVQRLTQVLNTERSSLEIPILYLNKWESESISRHDSRKLVSEDNLESVFLDHLVSKEENQKQYKMQLNDNEEGLISILHCLSLNGCVILANDAALQIDSLTKLVAKCTKFVDTLGLHKLASIIVFMPISADHKIACLDQIYDIEIGKYLNQWVNTDKFIKFVFEKWYVILQEFLSKIHINCRYTSN